MKAEGNTYACIHCRGAWVQIGELCPKCGKALDEAPDAPPGRRPRCCASLPLSTVCRRMLPAISNEVVRGAFEWLAARMEDEEAGRPEYRRSATG